jgi:hypothetical protein
MAHLQSWSYEPVRCGCFVAFFVIEGSVEAGLGMITACVQRLSESQPTAKFDVAIVCDECDPITLIAQGGDLKEMRERGSLAIWRDGDNTP